ncbi:MAG TPA: hypothetical protein VFO76_03845, partial [Candidatus Kapabacteria bacterium]|nr:hypothetical protein [Candidatus Kapabacteria bacterium]
IGLSMSGGLNFLGGGQDNDIEGHDNVLGGGENNNILSGWSFIGGGRNNSIDLTTGSIAPEFSAIVGGDDNHIHGVNAIENSFIGGGLTNTVTGNFSSIVGGTENAVVGDNSSILGGENNTLTGAHSVILGGQELNLTGNNSIGFNAFVSGSPGGTFTTTANNSFFLGNVDILIANNGNVAHKLEFFEPSSSGTFFTSFKAGIMSTDVEYVLPISQGAANSILTNDGSGTLRWDDGSTLGDWKITGNSNTDPATPTFNFLGTINKKSLEFHVFNSNGSTEGTGRVMRFEPMTGPGSSPNIIGGFSINGIASGGMGNVICGGGSMSATTPLRGVNTVGGNFNVLVGGNDNVIITDIVSPSPTDFCFLGGGLNNTIDVEIPDIDSSNLYSVLVGGYNNHIYERGTFVGGGVRNKAEEEFSVLCGGKDNHSNAGYAIICGGELNIATGVKSFIGGGTSNNTDAQSSVIVGGTKNTIGSNGAGAFIGGGGEETTGGTPHTFNKVTQRFSSIVGGAGNLVERPYGIISGGADNTITGPSSPATKKADFCSIGGGEANLISTNLIDNVDVTHATIPGGDHLVAKSYAQTVMGSFNTNRSKSISGTVTGDDQLLIVGNGNATTSSNAFEVTYDGRSQVFNVNGNGATSVQGGTYRDNTIEAWGECIITQVVPTVVFSNKTFGCTVAPVLPGTGLYRVTVNLKEPVNNTAMTLTDVSVTATLYKGNLDGGGCYHIQVENKTAAAGSCQFDIRIRDQNCNQKDNSFMFHVTGR